MGAVVSAVFLSEAADVNFPTTGKFMTVKVQCGHNGENVDITDYSGRLVTSDWTLENLREVIEMQVGVHRQCQRLFFAGKMMHSGCTIQKILGCRVDQLPDKVSIYLVVDRDSFPQKLGPYRLFRVPFEKKDFKLPPSSPGGEGFYWELKTGWTTALADRGRFQPVTMRNLVELGAKMFCWLRPHEILKGLDGRSLQSQPDVPRGGFVYLFRDNVHSLDPKDKLALDRYFPVAPQDQREHGNGSLSNGNGAQPSGALFRSFSLVDATQHPFMPDDVVRAIHNGIAEVDVEGHDQEEELVMMTPPRSAPSSGRYLAGSSPYMSSEDLARSLF